MTRTDLVFLLSSLALLGTACGEKKEPTTPTPVTQPPASATPPVASAETPAPEPHKPRKPFEVYSTCSDVVTVVFAVDPKAPTAGKRTIAPSSSIEGPRDNDGNQTVWLLDTNGEPLVKVNVTRGMKRVEIGRSCRTLDAR